MQVIVARKHREADDILAFELVREGGAAMPPFTAGAHVDVQLPGGLTRQYSLCNDPAETHRYLLGVLKDASSRGGSTAFHDRIDVGSRIEISAPKNHFPLDERASHSLLLAGGIGITPILSMAERLQRIGASFELHYCTRSPDRTAFRDRLASAAFAHHVSHHYDDGDDRQKLDIAALVAAPRPGAHLYVCGPQGFMNAVLSTARTAGWPDDRLHHEFFGADTTKTAGDRGFEIVLARSNRVIEIPAHLSVVDALGQAGVEVPVSCEQGVCGTCLTRVIDGEPDHRDLYLSPAEQAANTSFLPCCSRSRTPRLVIDL